MGHVTLVIVSTEDFRYPFHQDTSKSIHELHNEDQKLSCLQLNSV